MPNYVYSTITVENEKDWKSLKEVCKDGKFLQNLLPMPKTLEGTVSPIRTKDKVEFYITDAEVKDLDFSKGEGLFNKSVVIDNYIYEQSILDKNKINRTEFYTDAEVDEMNAKDEELSKKSKHHHHYRVQTKDEIIYNRETLGFDNWWDWRVANWGCKWDLCDLDVSDNDNARNITFSTPWSPISGLALELLAEKVPSFRYSYEEEQGWGGVIEFVNGSFDNEVDYEIPEFYPEGYNFYENGVITDDELALLERYSIGYLVEDFYHPGLCEDWSKGFYEDNYLASDYFIGSKISDVVAFVEKNKEKLDADIAKRKKEHEEWKAKIAAEADK